MATNVLPANVESVSGRNRFSHVGWDVVRLERDHPCFEGLGSAENFYYTHSYAFKKLPEKMVLATCEVSGSSLQVAAGIGSLIGVQFHPEKSQKVGLKFLDNFLGWNGQC